MVVKTLDFDAIHREIRYAEVAVFFGDINHANKILQRVSEKLRDALISGREDRWQNISTAPTDGTLETPPERDGASA